MNGENQRGKIPGAGIPGGRSRSIIDEMGFHRLVRAFRRGLGAYQNSRRTSESGTHKLNPILGRVAAICNGLAIASLILLVRFGSNWLLENWMQRVATLCLNLFFGIALVAGALAMRERSRTVLAKISFLFSIFVCWNILAGILSGR